MMAKPSQKICGECSLYVTKSDVSELKKNYKEYEGIDFKNSQITCPRCYMKNKIKTPMVLQKIIPSNADRLNESRPVNSPQVHIMFSSSKTPM
jgi:hypothetical protein